MFPVTVTLQLTRETEEGPAAGPRPRRAEASRALPQAQGQETTGQGCPSPAGPSRDRPTSCGSRVSKPHGPSGQN